MFSKEPSGAPSFLDLTNTFVLSSTPKSDQVLFEIPKALVVDPFRQRRVHQKSRTGCANCRRRRVKCNEETPCASCTSRRERCQRRVRAERVTSIPSMPTAPLLASSKSTDAMVSLHHMKLFHHFQTCTYQTISISPDFCRHTLQLSFQYEYLMNAILCLSARHLATLQPEDATYPTAAASHLSRTLLLFHHELSDISLSTSFHLDAFLATSILLQYEVWTSTDFVSPQDEEEEMDSFDPARDRIFALSSGLKQVCLKCLPLASDQTSVLIPQIRCNPRDTLVQAAQISSNTLAKYQDFFSYHRPLSMEMLQPPLPYSRGTDMATSKLWEYRVPVTPKVPDLVRDGYQPIITELCLILSFLPEARPPQPVGTDSPLLPALARYMFTFPVLCRGPFASMIHQSDPHALLLLYHFYRAVRILLPLDQYWWAHKRATLSERVLKNWLIRDWIAQKPT